jgi:hypothetical protein
MTNLFNFLPIGDFRNNGWNLVGTGVNNLFNALDNDDDTKYIKCPASKADAAVTFPIDTSSVPDGAVITSITVKARVATGTGSVPPEPAPPSPLRSPHSTTPRASSSAPSSRPRPPPPPSRSPPSTVTHWGSCGTSTVSTSSAA